MLSTRTIRIAAAVVALALVGAACSGDDDSADSAGTSAASTTPAPTTTTTAPTTAAATTAATTAPPTTAPGPRYYLSLGDSYASGFEPGVGNTTNGFAYQVADELKAAGRPLELVNVGCAGATTTSLLNTKGCPAGALGPGATPYDSQTQLEAAEAFLQSHPGAVDLITVSIGGNDVTKCGRDPDVATCVGGAVGSINTNLPVIAQRLRAAAGPDTAIIGTTYPDVILGDWVSGAPNGQQLATLSVAAFRSLINPALAAAYAGVQGTFVDVTEATGAYGPLTELTNLPPYGSIPVPVAKVCQLTHYCALQDIHPNKDGYKVIADLVSAAYTKAQPG
jgi:lysophospholipase L1-like esterase